MLGETVCQMGEKCQYVTKNNNNITRHLLQLHTLPLSLDYVVGLHCMLNLITIHIVIQKHKIVGDSSF